jgi:hypothetical protein
MKLYIAIFALFCNFLAYADQEKKGETAQKEEHTEGKGKQLDTLIPIPEIEGFLNKLKEAVKNDKVDDAAALFHYPFRCNSCKKPKVIKSKKQFKKRYKEIINKRVRGAIDNASIDNLFYNYMGFMIGRGEVWFYPDSGIWAINNGPKPDVR